MSFYIQFCVVKVGLSRFNPFIWKWHFIYRCLCEYLINLIYYKVPSTFTRYFASGWCKLTRDGPWPDPTQAYFWPAINKRPTRLWLGYFLTQPEEIFFWPEGKKMEKFDSFRGHFLNPNLKWLSQTVPSYKKLTRTITAIDWSVNHFHLLFLRAPPTSHL